MMHNSAPVPLLQFRTLWSPADRTAVDRVIRVKGWPDDDAMPIGCHVITDNRHFATPHRFIVHYVPTCRTVSRCTLFRRYTKLSLTVLVVLMSVEKLLLLEYRCFIN